MRGGTKLGKRGSREIQVAKVNGQTSTIVVILPHSSYRSETYDRSYLISTAYR